ncbi:MULTISPECIES: ribose 5-phosphate isomerase B [unclassified Pedobacter]|uniref:ribose 5-phosphate isomerase B n=1 Tax=unclassified Pedobacter TaxID=2628915 RepID=UPI001DB479DF|nr:MULTISPECIES: ribose 5-phosphate isomerase B [unclassified Pedobacter]CAH0233794.1 Ribose-5-phosphate isomerase B [Pedobacter sp. Bi36]CAH0260552.1 Ribose-5-phosphate isomerase B [Pedobacter sp. Bi126]
MSDTKIKIAIGADHAGFEYKEILKGFLQDYEVKDFGTYSENSVDYPDFAHPVAAAVENGEFTYGILLCGSANGVAITANKHQHIRAGLCWENEVASLVRKHNNANVLCIPARFVSEELAKEITTTFLTTEFEGGRHQNRVEKISC